MFSTYNEKTVLLTGASSGIGYEMALDLARRGAKLVLVARNEAKLNDLALKINEMGGKAWVFAIDLAQEDAPDELYERIKKAGIGIDLLINNAGYGHWGDFLSAGYKRYQNMIELNMTTLTTLCYLFLPDMVRQGGGGIINVASIVSFMPVPYCAVYAASKAYVLNFSQALRHEYQSQGISIMALCPGSTQSNFACVALGKSTDEPISLAMRPYDMKADRVAVECLDAFLKNKSYVVPGLLNKIVLMLSRCVPRGVLVALVGRLFRKFIS